MYFVAKDFQGIEPLRGIDKYHRLLYDIDRAYSGCSPIPKKGKVMEWTEAVLIEIKQLHAMVEKDLDYDQVGQALTAISALLRILLAADGYNRQQTGAALHEIFATAGRDYCPSPIKGGGDIHDVIKRITDGPATTDFGWASW